MQIGLVVVLRLIELLLLDLNHDRPLRGHLVKLLEQLVAQRCLLLVERLHSLLDLLNRVQLKSCLVDRIHQLVHTIEEHPDVLFNLPIAHQVGEVAVGVVALFGLLHGQSRGSAGGLMAALILLLGFLANDLPVDLLHLIRLVE